MRCLLGNRGGRVVTTLNISLEDAIERAENGAKTVMACPAHDDQEPSLSVAPGKVQKVVLHCFADCTPWDICQSVGLSWDDICNEWEPEQQQTIWTPAAQHGGVTRTEHQYQYVNEEGELLYEVLRVQMPNGKKRFFQRRPDPEQKHGYSWNLDGVRRVIFNLPSVIEGVKEGKHIHIAEGEKCVRALEAVIPIGDVATCNSGGAGSPSTPSWPHDLDAVFAGAHVTIYADADDKGRAHARDVREGLMGVGATVRVVEAPAGSLPSGKAISDVADHLEAGHTLDTLLEITPEEEQQRARGGVDITDLVKREKQPVKFVIGGTLAERERLLLIGFEGHGKSTLCRQIGVCTAAGMHPFTLQEMEPKKVMFVDAENQPHQVMESWSNLVGLNARHGYEVKPGMMTVLEEYDSDRDFTDEEGEAWFRERIYGHRPDLIVIGPLTNVVHQDLKDFDTVNRLRRVINAARTVSNSAIIMEHHAPLRGGVDKVRELRPYGSGLFLRWPDFSYGLQPTETDGLYEWRKQRGDRVRGRVWPEALRAGNQHNNSIELPWMMAEPEFM